MLNRLKRLGGIALLVVLFGGLLSFSIRNSYQVPPNSKANQSANHQTTNVQKPVSLEERLARSDERLGDWTEAVAIFTFFLTVATIALAAISLRQIKLGRDEFIATHRPRIFVQTVSITENGKSVERYASEDRAKTTPCEGIITVSNGGDSAAFIVEWQSIVYLQLSGAVFRPPLDVAAVQRPKPNSPGISPGVIESIKHFQVSPTDRDWRQYQQGVGHRMFFIGRISYEGPDKIRRRTGFCREWDKALGEGRWKTVKDSEYEYAY